MIYQLDAIEYLFVFFQLKLVNHFIFQTKMQFKTTPINLYLITCDCVQKELWVSIVPFLKVLPGMCKHHSPSAAHWAVG